jgi:hypothetical protein
MILINITLTNKYDDSLALPLSLPANVNIQTKDVIPVTYNQGLP